jgi:3-oxoacyl-(acyl-carrier-protein) synthase/acyl carrier protein
MNKTVYTDLSIEHPIVKNHTIRGQALLPGLAYIDFLYRLAKDELNLDFKKHSLKHLAIYNPLYVEKDNPTQLKTTFTKKSKGWDIKVEKAGTESQNNSSKERLYLTAELHNEEIRFDEHIDIKALKRSSTHKKNIDVAYDDAGKIGLIHKNIIKAKGIIYLVQNGCLIDVRVDSAYKEKNQDFLFHPTLIDGAGMASLILLNTSKHFNAKEDLFLPLSYAIFYSKEPLQNRLYVRIDQSAIRHINDITTYDMDFFDIKGKQVATLKGLTLKLVRNQEQLIPDIAKDSSVLSDTRIRPSEENIKPFPVSNVETYLKKIFYKYINSSFTQIDLNSGFYELGLDSSQLLDLVKDIENSFNISLSPSVLFEYSNMKDLIKYLEEKFGQKDLQSKFESANSFQDKNILDNKHVTLTSGVFEFNENEPYLQDHLMYDRPVLMGITYPCLALESYIQNNPDSYPVELNNIRFLGSPASLNKNEKINISVEFNKKNGHNSFNTKFYINDKTKEQISCTGDHIGKVNISPDKINIDKILKLSKPLSKDIVEQGYQALKQFTIGSMLQTIDSAFEYNSTTHICKVSLKGKQKKGNIERLVFDPLLLNSCYVLPFFDIVPISILLPLEMEKILHYREMTENAYIVRKVRTKKDDLLSFDAIILTEDGEMIAKVINLRSQIINPSAIDLLSNVLPSIPKRFTGYNEITDIAVIGLAGKYPGAGNIEEFWNNLKDGKDCITEIPKNRWNWEKYFDRDKSKEGKIYCKWGGFIDGVDEFDPLFFNISPREAEGMDPQERLFLECVFNTLEDAGYTRETLANSDSLGGKVGVYAGVMWEEYQLYGANAQAQGLMLTLGGSSSSIANRISYTFNFNGPSMAVDTACSSSLTAIHLACQSLQRGECDAAIAGGVNLSIHPNKYLLLSQNKFMSTRGRCESFGKGGDGYVPGEGVGAVLLKPLSKAEVDGDHIYGIIKGSMLNAGGKTSGYTVPNPASQSEVIRLALENSGVDPRSISYIEAHGTGTLLGDPIEIAGLTKAFRAFTQDKQYCAIGSVKSNIGHTESASGIAALTKVLLQLKYKKLVPSLHSEDLNPNIDFSQTPFVVNRSLTEWAGESPRISGISSFGAGGANSHIIVKEYIRENSEKPIINIEPEKPAIVLLSAKSDKQLKEQAKLLLAQIQKKKITDSDLLNLSYTLQVGREAMEERLGFFVASIKELEEKLTKFIEGQDIITDFYRGRLKRNADTLAVFSADEDMDRTIEAWLEKKKYKELLELWINGLSFDWNRLYGKNKPNRMSLPLYPFERERYWIPDDIGSFSRTVPMEQKKDYMGKNRINDLLYLPIWEREQLIGNGKEKTHKSIVIVSSDSSYRISKTIKAIYSKKKPAPLVILIKLGTETKPLPDNEWICNINDADGFKKCLENNKSIDCLYFVSDGLKEKELINLNDLSQNQQHNEIQLLRLIKYVKGNSLSDDLIDCYIITRDNYRINDTNINPYGGGINGLAYSIAQGERRFAVRNIDISNEDIGTEDQTKVFLKIILKEKPSDRGELIKYFKEDRYKRVFAKLDLNNVNDIAGFKNNGVYVVLGGSGTVGTVITKYLLEKYNARIVWIGRSLKNSDFIREKLEYLKESNGEIFYIQADATDSGQIKNAIAAVKKKYRQINGAIFSGLVLPDFDNSLDKTSEEEFLNILNIKTKGSIHFYAALQEEDLDFLCFFSSAQAFSFSGAGNLSAYTSGITFSDIFAQYIRERSKFPVGIINWGFWKSSLNKDNKSNPLFKNIGFLEDKEGCDAFASFIHLLQKGIIDQFLCLRASGFVQNVMNVVNDEIISISLTDGVVSQQVMNNSSPDGKEIIQKQNLKENFVENFDLIKKNTGEYINAVVIDQLSRSLKVSKSRIRNDVAFSDYGVDSIIGVAFIKQLNDVLGININAAILFDYTNVDSLTSYIVKTYKKQIISDQPNIVSGKTDVSILKDLENRFYENDISTESLIKILLNMETNNG